ncbi:MAG TPA: hypothetical protein VJS69_03600 [Candidatus Krumholzibacteria bacterium]|nr:hypothetical protein [Candidatus Krumholzibacteria bacterium]
MTSDSPPRRRRLVAAALACALALISCWKVDADLKLSTHKLDFGTSLSEATFTVTNDSHDNALTTGVTSLDYQLKSDHAWLTVQPASGHLDGEQTTMHTVTIDRSALLAGENLATIRATSNGGSDDIAVHVTRSVDGSCTDPPTAPGGPTPENGATGVSVDGDLSWTGGESQCDGLSATYDVYFGTATPPPFHHNSGDKKTFNPGRMAANTLIYWRIVAKDGNGSTSGPTWSFRTEAGSTTCTDPLTALALSAPADGATGVSQDVDLSWQGGDSQCVGHTSMYQVYFGTSSTPAFVDSVAGKTYDPGHLDASTTYYWKIVASDGISTRTSATRHFTTAAPPCTNGPADFTSLTPSADATNVSVNQDLSWSGGDSQCNGLTATYDVYFGTSSPARFDHNNGSDKSWNPGTLAGRQTYYWRVVAKDANGSRSSAERKFTTACDDNGASLDAPCTPSPSNGQQKADPKTALSWECGTTDCDDPLTFTIYLGKSATLDDGDIVGTTSARSYKPGPGMLKGKTTYYWKVVAHAGITDRPSPVWSFKTR